MSAGPAAAEASVPPSDGSSKLSVAQRKKLKAKQRKQARREERETITRLVEEEAERAAAGGEAGPEEDVGAGKARPGEGVGVGKARPGGGVGVGKAGKAGLDGVRAGKAGLDGVRAGKAGLVPSSRGRVEVEYVSAPLEASSDASPEEAAAALEARRVQEALGSVEAIFGGDRGREARDGPGGESSGRRKRGKRGGEGGGGESGGEGPLGSGLDAGSDGDDEGGGAPGLSDGDDEGGGALGLSDGDDEGGGADDSSSSAVRPSRRVLREAARARLAELKRRAPRPEVVEVWDASAADPDLLVRLKCLPGSVPVPRHWSQKRAYLAGKRGIERPPFRLPGFLRATGVGAMRDAYLAGADSRSLKKQARDRMAPKMGRMDVDYAVLHDAFFVKQTKPRLTEFGDLYYEGKEFETRMDGRAVPGVLSKRLQRALGMRAAKGKKGDGNDNEAAGEDRGAGGAGGARDDGADSDGSASSSSSSSSWSDGPSPLVRQLRQLQQQQQQQPGDPSSAPPVPSSVSSPPLPPPWLINMQRYGPPPAYPTLRIPGLNAPLPPGASYGFQPGGWGKPPVDERGAPLYGDAFGLGEAEDDPEDAQAMRRPLWGEPRADDDEEEEESEEDEEESQGEGEDENEGEEAGEERGAGDAGEARGRGGGAPPLPADAGPEEPAVPLSLRKETPGEPAPARGPLFQVLEERKVETGGEGLMGSDHVYVFPPQGTAAAPAGARPAALAGGPRPAPAEAAPLAVDPSLAEEGLSPAELEALYAEARGAGPREDLSGMVAANAAERLRKQERIRAKKEEAKRGGGGAA